MFEATLQNTWEKVKFMLNELLLSCKQIEKLTIIQKNQYYEQLEAYCLNSRESRRNNFFLKYPNILKSKMRIWEYGHSIYGVHY